MTPIEQIQAIFGDVNTIKSRLRSLEKTLPPDPPEKLIQAIKSAHFMNESLRLTLFQLERKYRTEKGAGKV
jgi:hypothetical protein